MLGVSFNSLLSILNILSGITDFIRPSDYTLKAKAGSLWDKSLTVIGNEEKSYFNYSINQNIIFLVRVSWIKLNG